MVEFTAIWSYIYLCSASMCLGISLVMWLFTKAAEIEERRRGGCGFTLEWILFWIPFLFAILFAMLTLLTWLD